jgi:hypothetical protein
MVLSKIWPNFNQEIVYKYCSLYVFHHPLSIFQESPDDLILQTNEYMVLSKFWPNFNQEIVYKYCSLYVIHHPLSIFQESPDDGLFGSAYAVSQIIKTWL